MSEFVGPVGTAAINHTERELSYLFYFRRNAHDLEAHIKKLEALHIDVNRKIAVASNNNEVIQAAVKTWNKSVDKVLVEAKELSDKAAQIHHWFRGWFSATRFSVGRKSQKKIGVIHKLLEDGVAFGDRVSDLTRVQDLISTEDLNSTGYLKDFRSRVETTNQVIQALEDDNINLLGLYGMPGVGKTTMISALATYVKYHKIFEEVVVVTLSQTPELKVIQGDIANGLDLKFKDDDSLATRKNRLLERLSQDRKTLIILDNVWQRVELSELGIPQGQKNCKVIFTTRDADVCNSMDAGDSRIKVELLSPEESWQLFRKKAGDAVDSPAFHDVAGDILNECQGLPLIIATLGRALYKKTKTYWEAALQSLQDSTILSNPILTGMRRHVYSAVRLSYDYLENEEIKLCFLFCCFFPDGCPVSMELLFYYMMGEKQLTKVHTFDAARLQLYAIVDKLISSCLLLETKSGSIIMHDVVRNVAIDIASDPKEGNGFIMKGGMVLSDWPYMELGQCKRLSFTTITGRNSNWRLPNQIQAAHLLTLSFNGNGNLVEIPTNFFEEATNLLTLDLSYTGIEEITPAIGCLVELRTLLLEGCPLWDVHLSNELNRLEVLSLRYSTTEIFSVSGEMPNLKLLDLSSCSRLERISGNVISSFPRLEELYMFESFRAWEPEGKGYGKEYARLSEVTSLHHLTSLEFHVGNSECLSQSIPNWEKLTRFKIVVGVIDDFSPFGINAGTQMEKSMYIKLEQKLVANWVILLLGRTNFLYLKGCTSLGALLQLESSTQRILYELEVLMLFESSDDIALIRCDLLVRFQNLNKLVIAECWYLRKLIEFQVENNTASGGASSSSRINPAVQFSRSPESSIFPKLTYLRVCECPQLKYLFPMELIGLLSQLEELYISNCHGMKMVIVHENDDVDGNAEKLQMILPKLKVLSLEGLSCLLYIVRQDIHVDWPALEELTVDGCWELKKLPFGTHSVPELTKLVVKDADWFEELEWNDQYVKLRLQFLLDTVHLNGCESLKVIQELEMRPLLLRTLRIFEDKGASLLPCDSLVRLSSLGELVVARCQDLEKIIDFGREDASVLVSSSASVNGRRIFKSLPSSVFGNLRNLRVSDCHNLKCLLPMRVIRELPQLEKLYIHDCSSMETIVVHETAEDDGDAEKDKMVLPQLNFLSLHVLPQLSSLGRQGTLFDWPSLEYLLVFDCPGLKKLPFDPSSVPNLRKFSANENWFDRLEWEHQEVKSHLQQVLQ